METSQPILDEAERQELLALSRATLEDYLPTGRIPEVDVVHPALRRRSGAFVSLHKGEELRGCIGMLSEDHELFRTVQRCTISAALEDSRFRPVTLEEVPELSIEVSVLSPLRRVTDVRTIEVGKHGLVVTLGNLRGLLLPQVATQYGWDRDTFLSQTCRKAGLPFNAWRDPNVVIHVFEAQVFRDDLGPAS
jgi:AmmeMemoRadiSam system protein A